MKSEYDIHAFINIEIIIIMSLAKTIPNIISEFEFEFPS